MSLKHVIWTRDCATQNNEIDKQHKHFFEIVNRAIDLAKKTKISHKEVLVLVTELGNHAFYHFETEEEYLKKIAYPLLKEHAAKHAKYKIQMS